MEEGMVEPATSKKKLDKSIEREYKNKSIDNSGEESPSIPLKRKEIVDAIKNLEGIKRKLKKALNSA
jgi:hypothetical protein